jgi:hypothetical protein
MFFWWMGPVDFDMIHTEVIKLTLLRTSFHRMLTSVDLIELSRCTPISRSEFYSFARPTINLEDNILLVANSNCYQICKGSTLSESDPNSA